MPATRAQTRAQTRGQTRGQTRRQFCERIGIGLALIGTGAGLALGQGAVRTIKIIAKKFDFTPSVITLKAGEPVVLEFTTEDVLMGFSAPDLEARVDIPPGKTSTLRLTPKVPGEYAFICDVFCGDEHDEMGGKIIVVA